MNFKKVFLLFSLLILAVFISPKFFSQKLKIDLVQSVKIDSNEYDSYGLSFQVLQKHVYYSRQIGGILQIFKQDDTGDKCVFYLNKGLKNYFLHFAIDSSKNFIYLLFQNKILKYSLNESDNSIDHALVGISLNQSYDNIYYMDEKVIITRCYNYATALNDTLFSPFKVYNALNLNSVHINNLKHDAIGFSHLASYFYDVGYNKILFVNALVDKAYIFYINDINRIDSVGNGDYLNKGVATIPFDTKIIPFSNAKSTVSDISTFAKKIDRYEGGKFVNDSLLFIVMKNKGLTTRGKRTIFFYEFNSKNNKWEYRYKKIFKNKTVSKKYGIFQFFYPTPMKIINNHIYIAEAYLNETKVSKRKLMKAYSHEENFKYAVYEYYLDI